MKILDYQLTCHNPAPFSFFPEVFPLEDLLLLLPKVALCFLLRTRQLLSHSEIDTIFKCYIICMGIYFKNAFIHGVVHMSIGGTLRYALAQVVNF